VPADMLTWIALAVGVAVMLLVDLVLFQRGEEPPSLRKAALWSVGWMAIGLAFTAVVWRWRGSTPAGEYLAGYLIERSLSIDNIFIFAVILGAFAVPAAYHAKVLLWGIVGALVLRVVFIFAGIGLLERFAWTAYVLGLLLIVTGIRMVTQHDREVRPEENRVLRAISQVVPITEGYRSGRLIVVEARRRTATPLLAVLGVVAATDLLFAIDSIPAILAITTDSFIVVAANAFALLGMRGLYFALAGMMDRFVYLAHGLAVVLVFIGGKMIWGELVGKVPITVSLPVVVLTVLAAIGASLMTSRSRGAGTEAGSDLA
jgi:tellurite resistance protein TerC